MSSPFNVFTNYFGVYAQDDWRVNPKLTLNYGVRLEHETGPAGEEQQLHGRLRPTLNPGGALGNVVNPSDRPAHSSAAWCMRARTAPTSIRAIRRR